MKGYFMESDITSFDPIAINQHVSTLFSLAQGMAGKFVVCALTGDRADPIYAVQHFRSDGGANEMERMAYTIRSFCPSFGIHPDKQVWGPWTDKGGKVRQNPKDCRCKPLNLYVPWAVFRSDLEKRKKGSEVDIIASLAGTIDLDCDKGDSPDIPLRASGRLETSPGNYQDFFVYPKPLLLSEAKPIAHALWRMTCKQDDPNAKGDSTTKDVSHIWRIPGTLNFPHAEKIARRKEQGISTEPFLVRWTHQDGGLIAPEAILAAAPPEPVRAARQARAEGSEPLIDEQTINSALEALHPDTLPRVEPPATKRDWWLQIGMALHDWNEDQGKQIWDTWSRKSEKYDWDELDTKWDTFGLGKRGTDHTRSIGSIFMWARDTGWKPVIFFETREGLRPDTPIEFEDENIGSVTVRDILACPELYDGEKCFDPIRRAGRELCPGSILFRENDYL
jgi:Primase C terminal 2 (PriCT-2)/RepB DNA-primase from phage plasmid